MKPVSRFCRLVLIAALSLILFSAPASARAEDDPEPAAIQAAGEWLRLVDAGEYAASWEQASALFRSMLTREQWVQALGASRKPLGELASRTVIDARFTTTLPGASDGRYVVIRFQASFARKASAVETVTPMQEADGRWRVSGYFIK